MTCNTVSNLLFKVLIYFIFSIFRGGKMVSTEAKTKALVLASKRVTYTPKMVPATNSKRQIKYTEGVDISLKKKKKNQ